MKIDTLNTPERIKNGIESTTSAMLEIDGHLGQDLINNFTHHLSALFAHQNPECKFALARTMDKDVGSKFCLYLTSACIEFTTAWHCIRMGRIPASVRSCRVATEFLASAILLVVPQERLLAIKSTESYYRKFLKNSELSMWDLMNASKEAQGNVIPPVLRAIDVFNVFMKWIEDEPEIPVYCFAGLQHYRQSVHHPLSHGSTESWSYHFHGMDGNVAGPTLSHERIPKYIEAAQGVISIIHQFCSIFDAIQSASWWNGARKRG